MSASHRGSPALQRLGGRDDQDGVHRILQAGGSGSRPTSPPGARAEALCSCGRIATVRFREQLSCSIHARELGALPALVFGMALAYRRDGLPSMAEAVLGSMA